MTRKTGIKFLTAIFLTAFLIWTAAAVIIPRVLDLDSYKPRILSLLEKSLQRQVTYETASFSRQLIPAFVIKGLTIKEKTGGTNLLTVDRLTFRLALLPLIHKEVRLGGIVLDRPLLTLARNQAGVLSISDLFSGEPSAYDLQVSDIQVKNGSIHFTDHLRGGEVILTSLEKLDLQVNGLTRGGTTGFKLSTLLQAQGERAEISLAGKVEIPPREVPFMDAKLEGAFSVKNLDAGRYWPYYGRFLPFERIQGRLDIEGGVFKGNLHEFATKGSLSLRDLRLNYPAVFREPLTPRQIVLGYDLEVTAKKISAKSLDLKIDGLQVKGNGDFADIHGTDPRLTVQVSSAPFRLEEIRNYIPYGIIPRGTADFIEQHIKGGIFRLNEGRLDGRISQIAHMDQGSNYNALLIRASVDNGVMTFGPQVPLLSAIKGGLEFRGKDFNLSGLTGKFGESPFSLDGKIADYPLVTPASYPFTLSMIPSAAEVAWLLRQEKPGQMVFNGPSLLLLSGAGTAADFRLNGSWDLSRADYRFAQLLHKPSGLANRISFNGGLGATEARLTELHYILPSLDVTANATYRYAAKVPLSVAVATNQFDVTALTVFPALAAYQPLGRLQAAVTAAGNPAAFDSFQLQGGVTLAEFSLRPAAQLPPLSHLNGTINLSAAGAETNQLTGKLGTSDFIAKVSLSGFAQPLVKLDVSFLALQLSDLGYRSPGEEPVLENLAAKVSLQDGQLTIASLTGQVKRTSFALQGELLDFTKPKITLRASFPFLRAEDLLLFSGLQPASGSPGKPGTIALKLQVAADAGTVREIPFTRLTAELSSQGNQLGIQAVSLGILGGSVSANGRIELDSAGGPAYQAEYRLDQVDAGQFLQAVGGEQSVTGKLSATGAVSVRGSSPAELRKSIALSAKLHLQDGVINSPVVPGEKIPYSKVDTDLEFSKGVLTVQNLNAGIFGGTVSGSGTAELDSAGGPRYEAEYRLDQLDAGQFLQAVSGEQYVTGQLTAAGAVTMQGSSPAELKKSVRVTGKIELTSGKLFIAAAAGAEQGRVVPFKAVQGRFSFESRQLTARSVRIDIFDGIVFADGSADFTIPHEPGYQASFHIESIDAARLDEALGFQSDFSGRLEMEGELAARGGNPDALRKSVQGAFEIHFKKGVINKFGFVSKIFSILNVSQLFALRLPDMVSTGMPYDSINGSFIAKNGIFSTSDLALDSPSINLTVVGKSDTVRKEIDLLCAVQPLQTLSMIVSRIPVIGWLLTGGNKSFLVTYYEAKGSWNDPMVTGRNMATLPGGVYNVFKRVYNLPENMITNTGSVFLGN